MRPRLVEPVLVVALPLVQLNQSAGAMHVPEVWRRPLVSRNASIQAPDDGGAMGVLDKSYSPPVQKYEPGNSAWHFAFAPMNPPRFPLYSVDVKPRNRTVRPRQHAMGLSSLQSVLG